MDGKLMENARRSLAQVRARNEELQIARRAEAYRKAPELQSVERELRALVPQAAVTALRHGENVENAIGAIAQRSLALQDRRRQLLREAGYPENYIDEIYSCPLCQDTGYRNGVLCSCLEALYREEVRKSLSSLLKLGSESFETFDLSYYSERPDGSGDSPRQTMRMIRDYCRLYAEKFSKGADNLLFQGGTGLGKTFLSACIARVVAGKGFSVAYESAVACLSAFELQKFSRGTEAGETAQEQVQRYLGCDLMIMDDLGTEMSGGYAPTALYTLIDSRLCEGRTTIISTNLSDEELSRRYSPQIVSRLKGEYTELVFKGSDIRRIKKDRELGGAV
ncbi:MAG: ATP-binding protein [Oscillospiraceae bacterium]|nr:ATP-binding protein [Oscillospiraceae bacterium]